MSLRDQAYALLKDAIAATDIYSQRQPLRAMAIPAADQRDRLLHHGVQILRQGVACLLHRDFIRR